MSKITYYYTEYKDCPEATEISRERERGKIFSYFFCFLIFIFSLVSCFAASEKGMAIAGVIICPIWFFYLVKFYDVVTNQMISEAIRVYGNKKQ